MIPPIKDARLIAGMFVVVLLAPISCAPRERPAPPADASWQMELLAAEWYLAGFEEDLDLSGIAAADEFRCLVGSDESFYVQPGVVDAANHRIEAGSPVALPLVYPEGKQEIDIEGIAYCPAEQCYFVTGSHGLGKKKGDYQPDRLSVFRVPVDAESGEPVADGIERASLEEWIERTPLLVPYLRQPLQQNGFNIEGLTCANGTLYFGLRAPNKDGQALVLEIPSRELFDGMPRELTVHQIAIGDSRGIREIAAIRGGFLLLTGNASAEASKRFPTTMAPGPDVRFELLFWDGASSTPVLIGALPENGGKAEALLVTGERAEQVDMLIVFDGLTSGGPVQVRVHRGDAAELRSGRDDGSRTQ